MTIRHYVLPIWLLTFYFFDEWASFFLITNERKRGDLLTLLVIAFGTVVGLFSSVITIE